MKLRFTKSLALGMAVAGVLVMGLGAFAQENEEGEHGSMEVGVRQNWGTVYGRSRSFSLFPSFPGTTGGSYPQASGGPFTSLGLPYQPSFGTSRFFEYQDMPNGLYLKSFQTDLDNVLGKNLYVKAQGRDGIEKDQTYLLNVGEYGKANFQFRWDDTPHTFTNTAQTLFTQTAPGFFAVAAPIQTTLAAGVSTCTYQQITGGSCALANTVNGLYSTVMPVSLGLRRRAATAGFRLTPTANWDLTTSYMHEDENGSRPLGNASGFELPEPIRYTTQDVRGGAEYGDRNWGVQLGFAGSLFDNHVGALTYVSPYSTNAATNQGRFDLYPSNRAYHVTMAGAFSIGKYVRVMASIVPGWMSQNDPFLPYTINSGTTGCPGGPCNSTSSLPTQSYRGSKHTLAMNYTIATKPVHNLGFTIRYRSYDYNNDSPKVAFAGAVITDGSSFNSSADSSRVSVPRSFYQKTAEFEGVYAFHEKNFFKVGYKLDRMDRTHRDIGRTQEGTFSTSLDLNPNKLTLFRLSYKHGDRTPSYYQNNDESYAFGEGGTAQMFAFRRFDEARRTRDGGEALLEFSPTDELTFAASFDTNQNAYANHLTATECTATNGEAVAQAALSNAILVAPFNPNCLSYGLLKDISAGYSFDVNYSPIPAVVFFAEYAHEKYNYQQRSRDRTYVSSLQAAPAVLTGVKGAYDDPSNDWYSWSDTKVHTYSAGADFYLKRRKVVLSSFYSLSDAMGDLMTTLLSDTPTMNINNVTTAALVTPALAGGSGYYNYPNTTNRLHQVVAMFKFNLTKEISPRIEYRFQRYDQHDWQSDIMLPYMGMYDPGSSYSTSASRLGGGAQKYLYLGADAPSYQVHVLAATVEWRF